MPGLRLLACFAHPDDEAFPVGGVLAQNVAEGRHVRLVTTTLGEEGDIRQEGAATRETLGEVRRIELSCAVQALRLESHVLLEYRDSGMAGWEANNHPRAYIKAPEDEVVERFVREIREFRPQVVLTFEPGAVRDIMHSLKTDPAWGDTQVPICQHFLLQDFSNCHISR